MYIYILWAAHTYPDGKKMPSEGRLDIMKVVTEVSHQFRVYVCCRTCHLFASKHALSYTHAKKTKTCQLFISTNHPPPTC